MFVLPGTIPFLRISGDSQGFSNVLISGSTAPSAGMEQGKKTSGLPVSQWCHRARSWKWGCEKPLCETFVNGGWPRHFYPRKNVNILGGWRIRKPPWICRELHQIQGDGPWSFRRPGFKCKVRTISPTVDAWQVPCDGMSDYLRGAMSTVKLGIDHRQIVGAL